MFYLTPDRRRNQSIASYFDDLVSPSVFSGFPRFGDSLINDFFGGSALRSSMGTDIVDCGENYELRCALPGVKKENINLSLEGDTLVIAAEIKEENENYLRRESRTGSFKRAFTLEGVKPEDISAKFEDGILKVRLTKKAKEEASSTPIAID